MPLNTKKIVFLCVPHKFQNEYLNRNYSSSLCGSCSSIVPSDSRFSGLCCSSGVSLFIESATSSPSSSNPSPEFFSFCVVPSFAPIVSSPNDSSKFASLSSSTFSTSSAFVVDSKVSSSVVFLSLAFLSFFAFFFFCLFFFIFFLLLLLLFLSFKSIPFLFGNLCFVHQVFHLPI